MQDTTEAVEVDISQDKLAVMSMHASSFLLIPQTHPFSKTLSTVLIMSIERVLIMHMAFFTCVGCASWWRWFNAGIYISTTASFLAIRTPTVRINQVRSTLLLDLPSRFLLGLQGHPPICSHIAPRWPCALRYGEPRLALPSCYTQPPLGVARMPCFPSVRPLPPLVRCYLYPKSPSLSQRVSLKRRIELQSGFYEKSNRHCEIRVSPLPTRQGSRATLSVSTQSWSTLENSQLACHHINDT